MEVTATAPSTVADRLYAGQVGYLRTKVLAVVLMLAGPAFIGLAVAELFTDRHLSAGVVVVAVLLIGLGLFVASYASPRMWRKLTSHDRQVGPYLEVTGGRLRFQPDSGGPAAQIELGRTARAEFAYRMANATGPGRSELRLYDAHDKKIATWNLWPMHGRQVARWLTHHGVKTDFRRR